MPKIYHKAKTWQLIKNPQFWSNQADILTTKGTMNIFTKFHKNWTTIVDFLLIAKFWAILLFFVHPLGSPHCTALHRAYFIAGLLWLWVKFSSNFNQLYYLLLLGKRKYILLTFIHPTTRRFKITFIATRCAFYLKHIPTYFTGHFYSMCNSFV